MVLWTSFFSLFNFKQIFLSVRKICLDPDPDWDFWPDPGSMNTDPKHCPKLRWKMKKRLQKQRGDSSVKRPSSVDEVISKPLFVGGLAWQCLSIFFYSNLNTIMMTILWAQIIIYLLVITEHIITSKILNYSFQFIDIDPTYNVN